MAARHPDTPATTPPLLDVDDIVRKAELHDQRLTELKTATASFLRRNARLGQLRERTLLLRSRAKYAWANCHNYRGFVKESQAKFNDEAAAVAFMPPEGIAGRLEVLQRRHEQVLRDFEEQNKLAENANDLQTELGNLEYQLQIREASVKEASDAMKKILDEIVLPGHSGPATVVETDVPPSPSLQGSEPMNQLIELYFRLVGNVRDALEQKAELEAEYHEDRGERDFKAEHEQYLDTSDAEFEALWQEKLSQAALALAEAKRVAESALDTCLNEGLNPEDYRRRPKAGSDRSVSDSAGDEISRILPDIDIQGTEDTGFVATGYSSDNDFDRMPVLTPETALTQRSHVPPPPPKETQPQPLLTDRVLSWMDDVNGLETNNHPPPPRPQKSEAPARRPTSVSWPLKPPSRPLPPLPTSSKHVQKISSAHEQEDQPKPGQGLQPEEPKFTRRRSSDSNMAAVKHNAEFVQGLRERAGGRR